MEKFRKQIKKRLRINVVLAIFLVALFAALMIMDATNAWSTFLPVEENGDNAFLAGFRTGFSSSLIGYAIVRAVICARTLKDEKKLKALYIKETDERNLMIAQKASSASFLVTIIGLAVGCVIASFFSELVLMVLALVIVFVATVQISFYIYYSKKY